VLRRPVVPLVVALGCALATTVVWLLAFHTAVGARFDSTVLGGFTGLRDSRFEPLAAAVAGLDPIPFAAVALALVTVAVARHRPRDAVVVVAVLAGANVTTQLLKLVTGPHPVATPSVGRLAEAWPSGHTTAAMTLALSLVLVAPARARPFAAAAGGMFAVAMGYAVLVMGWHYPSDVVAAFGVATGWLALGVAALGVTTDRTQAIRPPARTVFAPAAVAALVGASLTAGTMLMRPARAFTYAEQHTAFVVAAVLVGAVGLALAAVTAAALGLIEDRVGPTQRRPAVPRS
jgi:membrane-associated phospholipid phosphatase